MKTSAELLPLMQKAVASHQAGHFDEAECSYLSVLDADPKHIDALCFLGALYVQRNQYDRGVQSLERAFAINPNQPELLNNLGVALCHLGRSEEAVILYRRAIQIQPDYYDVSHNLANLLYELGRLDEALPLLEQSLQKSPHDRQTHSRFVRALEAQKLWDKLFAYYSQVTSLLADDCKILTNLGNKLRAEGRSEDACFIYRRLVDLVPHDVKLQLNLGMIFHDRGMFDEAMVQFDHVLQLQPGHVDAMINRAGLLIEMNHTDKALESYNKALHYQPHSLDAQWGKALALLALGDYREGWALYETGFVRERTRGTIPFSSARWNGCAFPDKRLLIWGEQGLGDVLQFIRYAALCKQRGGLVIVMCREPLLRLLENCPYIDRVVLSATEADFDYHIPVMSLPYVFGTTLDSIPAAVPYLYVNDEARQKWTSQFLGIDDFKVGLVWAGNPRVQQIDAHVIDRRRSMSLELMKPLFSFDHVRFFSLQKDDAAAQIDACGLNDRLINYMPEVADLLDTAALIENLDLVISVDTSVVHLAGGLGKPVWVLSRFDGCWRWLGNRKTSPWYPTAKIFAQSSLGDWDGVIRQVAQSLQRELSTYKCI